MQFYILSIFFNITEYSFRKIKFKYQLSIINNENINFKKSEINAKQS